MKAAKPQTPPVKSFQNRIVSYGTKKADQFTANPLNPRLHPQFQREVMQEALEGIGWLAPVIENQRTGYLIDGHERVMQALARNEDVPFVLVDLSEEEEKQALATFDPIGSLAQYDPENLKAVMEGGDAENLGIALQQMLHNLGAQVGVFEPDNVYDEWTNGVPDFKSENKQGIMVLVHFETEADVALFAEKIGQRVLPTTKGIWFPERARETVQDKVWVGKEDES